MRFWQAVALQLKEDGFQKSGARRLRCVGVSRLRKGLVRPRKPVTLVAGGAFVAGLTVGGGLVVLVRLQYPRKTNERSLWRHEAELESSRALTAGSRKLLWYDDDDDVWHEAMVT